MTTAEAAEAQKKRMERFGGVDRLKLREERQKKFGNAQSIEYVCRSSATAAVATTVSCRLACPACTRCPAALPVLLVHVVQGLAGLRAAARRPTASVESTACLNPARLHNRSPAPHVPCFVPSREAKSIGAIPAHDPSEEATVRSEAVYVYGTDNMDTKTIQGLFEAYHPAFVQWINDSSCWCTLPRYPTLRCH